MCRRPIVEYRTLTGPTLRGRDPFNQTSNRSDREKRTTSKGGPVFSKLFRLDRTDPLSFGPKFPEILVEWIAPRVFTVRRALPWPPNKHFLQVSQSRYANLIDKHAYIKSFNTQLPNENFSILTDKVEAKAQQLYKT